MYGFGSKKALIEDISSTALTEYSVVVINGYLQSVNLKQVVFALAESWWEELKTGRRTSSGVSSKVQQPLILYLWMTFLHFCMNQMWRKMSLLCVLLFTILMGLG